MVMLNTLIILEAVNPGAVGQSSVKPVDNQVAAIGGAVGGTLAVLLLVLVIMIVVVRRRSLSRYPFF